MNFYCNHAYRSSDISRKVNLTKSRSNAEGKLDIDHQIFMIRSPPKVLGILNTTFFKFSMNCLNICFQIYSFTTETEIIGDRDLSEASMSIQGIFSWATIGISIFTNPIDNCRWKLCGYAIT